VGPGDAFHVPIGHNVPRENVSDVNSVDNSVSDIHSVAVQRVYQAKHVKFLRDFCKPGDAITVLGTNVGYDGRSRIPLHIEGTFRGNHIAILLDSGANISCINSIVVEGTNVVIEPTRTLLTTAGRTPLAVLGVAQVEFCIDGKTVSHNVYVVKGLNCSLLLGNDFLSGHSAVLNYGEETITISLGGKYSILPMLGSWENHPGLQSAKICSLEAVTLFDVVLSPHSTVEVPIQANIGVNNGQVDYDFDAHPDLVIKKGLHVTLPDTRNLNTKMSVNVTNTTHITKTLFNGTKVGTFIPTTNIHPSETSSSAVSTITSGIQSLPRDFEGDITDLSGNTIDINPNLSPPQLEAARKLIYKYRDVFARNDTDLEEANVPPYQIKVKSDEPIALPPYKLGPKEREELDRQVEALLEAGVIESCQSQYAAPSFVVKKTRG